MCIALRCSESTIKRATAYFHQMGWIVKSKRGYQSNVYYMDDELTDLDLKDETLFLREKRPVNDPVLEKPVSDYINLSTNNPVHSHREKQEKTIPEFLHKVKNLEDQQKQSLIDRFSEYSLVKAIEEAKWYLRKGNIIGNIGGYLWKAAKRLSL